LNYNIDGIELLKKHEGIDVGVNLAATRILDENDLKKIRVLKLKQAVKKVDRKGFASSSEEEEEEEGQELSIDEDDDGSEENSA